MARQIKLRRQQQQHASIEQQQQQQQEEQRRVHPTDSCNSEASLFRGAAVALHDNADRWISSETLRLGAFPTLPTTTTTPTGPPTTSLVNVGPPPTDLPQSVQALTFLSQAPLPPPTGGTLYVPIPISQMYAVCSDHPYHSRPISFSYPGQNYVHQQCTQCLHDAILAIDHARQTLQISELLRSLETVTNHHGHHHHHHHQGFGTPLSASSPVEQMPSLSQSAVFRALHLPTLSSFLPQ
jgi:hypothetical protein